MQYRLRTLLIVLALGPPLLAWGVPALVEWLRPDEQERRLIIQFDGNGSKGLQP